MGSTRDGKEILNSFQSKRFTSLSSSSAQECSWITMLAKKPTSKVPSQPPIRMCQMLRLPTSNNSTMAIQLARLTTLSRRTSSPRTSNLYSSHSRSHCHSLKLSFQPLHRGNLMLNPLKLCLSNLLHHLKVTLKTKTMHALHSRTHTTWATQTSKSSKSWSFRCKTTKETIQSI